MRVRPWTFKPGDMVPVLSAPRAGSEADRRLARSATGAAGEVIEGAGRAPTLIEGFGRTRTSGAPNEDVCTRTASGTLMPR